MYEYCLTKTVIGVGRTCMDAILYTAILHAYTEDHAIIPLVVTVVHV